MALRHRRSPALHGGFLLMSGLPLWFAVGTRLPFITDNVSVVGMLDTFFRTVDVTMLVMLACAAFAWWRQPAQPLPFQLAMLMTALQCAGSMSRRSSLAGKQSQRYPRPPPLHWSVSSVSDWGTIEAPPPTCPHGDL